MLEVLLDELLPQPPNAQDKEVSAKIRKQIVLRKLEYYLSKFGSSCDYVLSRLRVCSSCKYVSCEYVLSQFNLAASMFSLSLS